MKRHKLFLNGKEVTEEEFHRDGPIGGQGTPHITQYYNEGSPRLSEGLGCMKHQVPEMRRIVSERGLSGVRVLDNGAVELTSRGDRGRRGLMKLRGLCDNDGGYGDG